MRPKGSQSCADRLEKILQQPIFSAVLASNPELKDRIRIVSGSLASFDSDILEGEALSEVEIVIHSAASVSFDGDVWKAIETNVYGTYQLLQLCTQMQRLSVFLYVSTAFSQPHIDRPVERFYEPVVDPMLLLKCFQRLGGDGADRREKNDAEIVMNKLMAEPKMIPYFLSKNAAEALVQSYAEHLPIVMIRPSVGEFFHFSDGTSR